MPRNCNYSTPMGRCEQPRLLEPIPGTARVEVERNNKEEATSIKAVSDYREAGIYCYYHQKVIDELAGEREKDGRRKPDRW